jgi:hypothetical protein
LKNVQIFGGSLKSYASRDAAPTNGTQQHVRKWKFSETEIDEETLPLLSNDLPVLDVLKFMECGFNSDGKSTDDNLTITMTNTAIETLELNGKDSKASVILFLKLLQRTQQPFQNIILIALQRNENPFLFSSG